MAGIGVLNDVKVKVYGMQSINLNTEAIKVLGINFPYNRKLKGHKKNSNAITNFQRGLKLWRLRNLIFEEKFVIFKTISFSKLISKL